MKQETMTSRQRIDAAVRLEKPDRVPIVPWIGSLAARHMGLIMRDYYFSPQTSVEAGRRTFQDLGGYDGLLMAGPGHPDMIFFGLPVRVKMPGRELPDDAIFQIDESIGFMQPEDYDIVIDKGWNWYKSNVLDPRLHPEARRGLIGTLQMAARVLPLIRLAQQDGKWYQAHGTAVMASAIFPVPFEMLCQARSLHEFPLDLFRRPDKVLAAQERMLPEMLQIALGTAKQSKSPWVFIGGTRGSATMISGKLFAKFYLPILKRATEAIVAEGLTPLYHFDSDWAGHLPYLKDMPKGKCVLEIDSTTDIFKAKEILRGHTCIMGDVPATLFKLGTPQQVADYCRRLIDEVGGDGGFILSSGCEVPFDAKWENVKAMIDTGKTYELSKE
jgi:uroporphyrinogen-III decarboxylase